MNRTKTDLALAAGFLPLVVVAIGAGAPASTGAQDLATTIVSAPAPPALAAPALVHPAGPGAPGFAASDPFGLGWLVGEWEGEGWMQFGPDRRETFHQHEMVRLVLGGRALLIEGTAFAAADGRVLDEIGPVHEALALIARDPDTGDLSFRAYRVDGERVLAVDAYAEVVDGTLAWGFRDPQVGEMRYTLALSDDGEWHETGRISPDGEQWFDFFEMRLRRVDRGG